MLKTVFEKETCGRCGGSGHYSYNQIDGTRCYGCGGRGERLTKRGAAARAWFKERCSIPAAETLGKQVFVEPSVFSKGGWWTVKAIEPCGDDMITLAFPNHDVPHWTLRPTGLMQRRPTQEDIDAALAYQGTLTKTGKPKAR